MKSEADGAFLHVHLDHVQLKAWSRDYAITSGSVILVARFKIGLCKMLENVHSKTAG